VSIRLARHDRPFVDRIAWRLALDGQLPADALQTTDRQTLVLVLHQRGWSDVEIATHTRMSTYTTARIRERIKLAPNTSCKGAA
jgi:DNA-binding NarL/FixJ family response regulator